jgi:hypothetical protein
MTSPTPLLFERFNAEGNSSDAVVYLWEEELLLYKGAYYEFDTNLSAAKPLRKGIPDDATVKHLYLGPTDHMHIIFSSPSSDVQDSVKICKRYFVPDEEHKIKLCTMFQKHGSELKGVAQQLMQCVKQIKNILEKNKKELENECPKLDLRQLEVNFATPESDIACYFYPYDQFDDLDSIVGDIMREASTLENVTGISRKRKNPKSF